MGSRRGVVAAEGAGAKALDLVAHARFRCASFLAGRTTGMPGRALEGSSVWVAQRGGVANSSAPVYSGVFELRKRRFEHRGHHHLVQSAKNTNTPIESQ